MDTTSLILIAIGGVAALVGGGLLGNALWSVVARRRREAKDLEREPFQDHEEEQANAPVLTWPSVEPEVFQPTKEHPVEREDPVRVPDATHSESVSPISAVAVVTSELAAQQEDVLNRMEEIAADPDLIFHIYRLRHLNARVTFEAESALAREHILLDSDTEPQKADDIARLAMQSSPAMENIRLNIKAEPLLKAEVCRPLRLLLAQLLEALALANRFGRFRLAVDLVGGAPVFGVRAQGSPITDADLNELSRAVASANEVFRDPVLKVLSVAGILARELNATLQVQRTRSGGYEYILTLTPAAIDHQSTSAKTSAPMGKNAVFGSQVSESRSWRDMVGSSGQTSFSDQIAAAATLSPKKPAMVELPPLYREVSSKLERDRQLAEIMNGVEEYSDNQVLQTEGAGAIDDPLYVDLREFMKRRHESGFHESSEPSQGSDGAAHVDYAGEGRA